MTNDLLALKRSALAHNIANLPDKVIGQAGYLKDYFDRNTYELLSQQTNPLLDLLASQKASAAIGATPVAGVKGTSVHEQITDLKAIADNLIVGQIPEQGLPASKLTDQTVTADKMAKDALPTLTATATRTGTVVALTVHIPSGVTTYAIRFLAPSDFASAHTYTINGTALTLTDLFGEPLDSAWKSGAPVELTITGGLGFFKGGGSVKVQYNAANVGEGFQIKTYVLNQSAIIDDNTTYGADGVNLHIFSSGRYVNGNYLISTVHRKFNLTTRSSTNLADHPNFTQQENRGILLNGKMHFIGTDAGRDRSYRLHQVCSLATDTITNLLDLPESRYRTEKDEINGKIYIAGGLESGLTIGHDTFSYDPATNTYTKRAAIPADRGQSGCTAVGRKLYCMGGNTKPSNPQAATYSDKNEVYDTLTDTWTTETPCPDTHDYCTAAFEGDFVYYTGYYGGDNYCIHAYHPILKTWTKKREVHCPYAPLLAHNRSIIVCGGKNLIVYRSRHDITGADANYILATIPARARFRFDVPINGAPANTEVKVDKVTDLITSVPPPYTGYICYPKGVI